MSRLWLRIGIAVAGVLFLVFFLQFLAITNSGDPRGEPPPEERAEIVGRLYEFMAFSLVAGLGAGLIIGNFVARPIRGLSRAAARLDAGNLAERVVPRGSVELRELAIAFNAMAERLETADRARRNLLSDISHELRTPLTVLNGRLHAALDGVERLDQAAVANLAAQTGHLSRLVNDLRELSLAEEKRLSLDPEDCVLMEIAADCAEILGPLAAEGGIGLESRVGHGCVARADPFRVRQILINLLANAIRHSRGGGSVIMEGRRLEGRVFLRVVDDGEGIEAGQLPFLFDRFYRGDAARSRADGGAGLGLSIARALARAMGGDLAASSAGPGRGACFELSLPAASGS